MVTDEERDYMYDEYAKDPRMKLNLGIRRRLAPLLDNDRERDRAADGGACSRCPAARSSTTATRSGWATTSTSATATACARRCSGRGDRNGGFSRADFAQLYAPPLMDPVYGYQAVNVEAQLRTPTSLLRWLRRFIGLRKEHPVFGRGSYEPLHPANPKIFAHVRRYEDDIVLCVHNLARSAQAVELDLSAFAGPPPRGDVRPHALPADRRAPLPADAGPRAASSGSC